MSNCTTLPGIIKLEYIQAVDLTLVPKKHISAGCKISAIGNFTEIKLVGQANCSNTPERTNAGLIYNTKISGLSFESSDLTEEIMNKLQELYHVYRLTDVYGNQYLVGTLACPYPEIIFTPTNDSIRAIEFEISWISTLPPLKLTAL